VIGEHHNMTNMKLIEVKPVTFYDFTKCLCILNDDRMTVDPIFHGLMSSIRGGFSEWCYFYLAPG